MSYYFRLKTKEIRLSKNTPQEIIAFIDSYINKKEYNIAPPVHALFTLKRWHSLFYDNASRHEEERTYFKWEDGYWKLFLNCTVNYGQKEILEFAKWIAPYVAGHKPKEYIGTYREEGLTRRDNIYVERKDTGKGRIIYLPEPSELSDPAIIEKFQKKRQRFPDAIFLEKDPPRLLLSTPDAETMAGIKKAFQPLNEFIDKNNITVTYAKHKPKVSKSLRKKLGL